MKKLILTFLAVFMFLITSAQTIEPSSQTYEATGATRSGVQTWIIEKGKMNNVDFAALAGSDGSGVIPMQLNQSFYETTGDIIYGTSTYFLFPYDEESYIFVAPSKAVELGKDAWTDFVYVNFLSTNPKKVALMNDEKTKQWIVDYTTKQIK